MGNPFKIKGQSPANIGRAGDGKFIRLESPTAHAVVEEAKERGEMVQDIVRERRVPDRPVGKKTPEDEKDAVYADSIPWPESGPYNDADRPPMRLKGD